MKILIVDDETPIRQWFTFCIETSNADFEIAGEACNGKEAYEAFKESKPDVIITDIKMPFMDGIELMKLVKSERPSTDIVLLTNFEEFDYARQALKYGAEAYVLKSEIGKEEILNILLQIKRKREERRNSEDSVKKLLQNRRENFIQNIIKTKSLSAEEIMENLKTCELPLAENNLFSLAVKVYGKINLDEFENILYEFDSEIINRCLFQYKNNVFVLIANLNKAPSLLMQINSIVAIATSLYNKLECSIGISNVKNGFNQLKSVVEEACSVIAKEFFSGRKCISYPMDYVNDGKVMDEIKRIEIGFSEAITKWDKSSALEKVYELFGVFEQQRITNINDIFTICSWLVNELYSKLVFSEGSKCTVNKDYDTEIKNIEYLKDLKLFTIQTLEELYCSSQYNVTTYSLNISKVIEFIRIRYCEPISLKDLADFVHLSPEYLCKHFKDETGENISNYLITLRLKKAKELLQNTDLKVYEIAEKIGYPNISYFSKMFKKYTNLSPYEFRNKNYSCNRF